MSPTRRGQGGAVPPTRRGQGVAVPPTRRRQRQGWGISNQSNGSQWHTFTDHIPTHNDRPYHTAQRTIVGCGLSTISSGRSAYRNSHGVPSGQGAVMPRATPENPIRMAESRGKELTPGPECSPHQDDHTVTDRVAEFGVYRYTNNGRARGLRCSPPPAARLDFSVGYSLSDDTVRNSEGLILHSGVLGVATNFDESRESSILEVNN